MTASVFATLEAARADYEARRTTYTGRDYSGLWSAEEPNGPAPDEYPEHGWLLAYANPGEDETPFGEADEVGISLRAHPLIGGE